MEMNDPANWRVADPSPSVALEHIVPLGQRAVALLARNLGHPVLQGEFVRLYGAVDMLGALDYHHDNLLAIRAAFDRHLDALERLRAPQRDVTPGEHRVLEPELAAELRPTDSDSRLFKNAQYEAAAYLCRLGQFYYFAKSAFMADVVAAGSITAIQRLIVFRHKFAAHRSIDKPQGDLDELQTLHAMSLALGGMVWHPLSNGRLAMSFQIRTESSGAENFVPEVDHPAVMGEAYELLSSVLA